MQEHKKQWERLFQQAVLGVVQQGCLSFETGEAGILLGRYRTAEGKKCVAGQLIPDELYDPDIERKLIGEVIDRLGLTALKPFAVELDELQQIHDCAVPWRSRSEYDGLGKFLAACQRYAAEHDLKMPELPPIG
jgi:hypothetical protein